jgi:uncharacterized lipoprotein NlpE involved in copper resistance
LQDYICGYKKRFFSSSKKTTMKKTPLLTIAAATLLFGCQNRSEQTIGALKTLDSSVETAVPAPAADTVHNSQNSIDWDGSYKGILPYADCNGIETELILKKDMTYTRLTTYLGRPNAMVGELSGKFTWNKENSIIDLEGVEDGPNQFKVGENTLTQLDIKGKEVKGADADKYILRK